jgi:hypothetical protein
MGVTEAQLVSPLCWPTSELKFSGSMGSASPLVMRNRYHRNLEEMLYAFVSAVEAVLAESKQND